MAFSHASEYAIIYINDDLQMRLEYVQWDDAPDRIKQIMANDYYSEHRSEHPIVMLDNRRMNLYVQRAITNVEIRDNA